MIHLRIHSRIPKMGMHASSDYPSWVVELSNGEEGV